MEAIQSADDPGIDATLSLLVEEELGQQNEGSSAAQAQNSASNTTPISMSYTEELFQLCEAGQLTANEASAVTLLVLEGSRFFDLPVLDLHL